MNQFLEAAVDAARAAGAIQLEHLDRPFQMSFKGSANIVTEVDLKCEREIVERLRARFPDHSFLAEEGGESRPGSDHLWIIDPLDGTTNFAHGLRRFCVSIALSVSGKVVAGTVHDPVAGLTYTAARGEGAFLNGAPIRVSEVDKLDDALICTGLSYDRGPTLVKLMEVYLRVLPRAQSLRRDGCAALDLCEVARGGFDGFWEFNLNAWDVAAGSLILEEAGGKWTGLDGRDVDLFAKEFLCTNGRLHAEMIEVINRMPPLMKVEWVG